MAGPSGDGVTIPITAENQQMKEVLDDSENTIKAFGSRIKQLLGVIAGAFIIKKGFDFGKMMVDAASESEQAEARLRAVVKATGGAAELSAKQMIDFADSLQQTTRFESETTQGAMAVIATFREIRGDQFKAATKAAMDMSEVLGTDLQGAAMQVAKALNDPTEGLNALRRAGVSFTDQQKEQIKTLQEAGKIEQAQQIILDELTAEFGGAAEAMGKTFSGQLARLKNNLGDVAEDIGKALIPAIQSLMPAVEAAGKYIQSLVPAFERAIKASMDFAGTLMEQLKPVMDWMVGIFQYVYDSVVGVLSRLAPAAEQHVGKVGEFMMRIGEFFAPLLDLVQPIFDGLMSTIETLLPPLWKLCQFFMDVGSAILDFVQPTFDALIEDGLVPLIGYVTDSLVPALAEGITWFTNVAQGILTLLKPALDWLGAALGELTSMLLTGFGEAWGTSMGFIGEFVDFIWGYLKPVLLWLLDAAIIVFTEIQVVIENWKDVCMAYVLAFELAFVKTWEVLKYWLTEVIPEYLSWFGRNWQAVFTDAANFLATVFSNMYTNVTSFFKSIWSWMKGEGFDWKWTSLTEGFEATMEELPKIASRKKSELEKGLETQLGEVTGNISRSFDEKLKANRERFWAAFNQDNQRIAEAGPQGDKNPFAEGTPAHEARMKKQKRGGDAGKDKKGGKTGFEDLMALNKRISAAAAGAEKEDKVAKAVNAGAKAQVQAAKEQKEEQKKANKLLEHNNKELKGVRKEVAGAGALK